MQPLVLHPPSLATPFGPTRFIPGPERLLNRPWADPRGCSPQAAFTRQSMSGSPPAEEPSVASAESNPSRYPLASSPAPSAAEEAPVVSHPRPHRPSLGNDPLPTTIPPISAVAPVSVPSVPLIPPRYPDPGPLYTDPSHAHPELPQFPLAAFDRSISGAGPRAIAQRSTRRTKAHVASACVNCKKKHLGCDPARPCRRCVLAGKASSCVDVTHKKRGRPPLKAEDSSLRPYTHPDHSPVPAESQPAGPPRASFHRPTSSRELRPMTDLQGVGEPGPPPPPPGAATMRGPRSQPHRWSASVFPLTRPMEASPGMLNAAGRRPFSSSGPASYPQPHPSVPPSAFAPVTSGFNPVIKTPTGPPGMDMRFQQYPGPALPPPTTPPQPNPAAGIPYIPYAESPGSAHHPGAESRLPAGPRESYLETSVRLPPIHQATANPGPPMSAVPPGPPGHAYHTHRLSDPYPASWVLAGSEGSSQDPRTSAQPKRPMDSILDHPSHHRRLSSSATGSLNPIPRHLGPLELPTPVTPAPSLPAGAQTTQPVTEAEPDPRPVKRRKMALDDMVNG